MDIDNLIVDIDKLIENSRFFMYDSEEKYKKCIDTLLKMKNHLIHSRLDKVLKEGGDEFDDS